MRILISNDDGVHAPGISALADALRPIAAIDVVAPDRDLSGASSSLSLNRPLKTKRMPNGFICVDGTPTDCVHLAITGYLKHMPDMVVTGINNGANLGDDVLYSGTVGAAAEGRFEGFTSIALSLASHKNSEHYDSAGQCARLIVDHVIENPLSSQTMLNVNVPDVPFNQIKGFKVTRLGKRHRAEKIIKEKDPRGNDIYWIGLPGAAQDTGPGTDFHAIENNYVSITPLQLDLTHIELMEQLDSWVGDISI